MREFFERVKTIMTSSRTFLNGSVLEYVVVAFIFLVITTVLTDYILFDLTTRIFTQYPGDGSGGFMWYSFAQPGINPFLHHSTMVNYPYGEDIGGPTFFTYFGLWLPLRILSFIFGPIAGVNLLMYGVFLLSALSAYWLIKRLGGTKLIAFFAGYATAFVPYTMGKALNHMPYTFAFLFVFMLAAFIALWRRPTIWRACLFGASVSYAYYCDGYYLLIASVFVVALVLSGLGLLWLRRRWQESAKLIGFLCISLAIVCMLMTPVLTLQLTQGGKVSKTLEDRRSNISNEIHSYRSNVIDFMLPADSNPFLKNNHDFQVLNAMKNVRSNGSENQNYIGYVVVTLNAIGLTMAAIWLFLPKWSSLRRSSVRQQDVFIFLTLVFGLTTVFSLSFMFSPEVIIRGVRIPLPGQFMIDHNISLWRVMSRFFVVLHAIAVIYAAYVLWVVLSSVRMSAKSKQILLLSVPCVAILITAMEYANNSNQPTFNFSSKTYVSEGYRWLQKQKNIKNIVETPVVNPLDTRTADYVTMQIVHDKRILNRKEDLSAKVTNVYYTANSELIDWAYQLGAQALITHHKACTSVPWGKLLYSSPRKTSIDEKMCIYSIDRPSDDDPYYVRYGNGFFNFMLDQKTNTLTPGYEGEDATLSISDADFKDIKKPGRARIDAQITATRLGSWQVVQDKKVVAFGTIPVGEFTLTADVNAMLPVEFRFTPSDKGVYNPGEILIINLTATKQ